MEKSIYKTICLLKIEIYIGDDNIHCCSALTMGYPSKKPGVGTEIVYNVMLWSDVNYHLLLARRQLDMGNLFGDESSCRSSTPLTYSTC